MLNTPTCFIVFDARKTYGPYTVQEALVKIDSFSRMESSGLDPAFVSVWNLGWRKPQPLELAKSFLLADLGKSKYTF
jgi:hypothetical protein